VKLILIIDDEKDFGYLVKEVLEITGRYNVIIATSGEEGIQATTKYKPDLILLDLKMPDIDGVEVLKYLRTNDETALIPVIMLTVASQSEFRGKVVGLHIEDYLVKPVAVAALKESVDAVLEKGTCKI